MRQRRAHLAYADGQHAQVVVGVGMIGLGLQNGAVEPFGFGKPTGAVVVDGLPQGLIKRQ